MKKITFVLVILFLFQCCKEESRIDNNNDNTEPDQIQKLSPIRPNLNISILIDLSDRIDPQKYPNPTMDYYQRDLGYINSIAKAYETHLINKKFIKINDCIQLYLDPEPADKLLNSKVSSLKVSFTKDNATKEAILYTSNLYDSISKQIYESAIKDNKFVGSDTWRFFKSKVKDYCIKEEFRNILIVLTDGYMYHQNTVYKDKNRTTYLTPQLIRSYRLTSSSWLEMMQEQDLGFMQANEGLSQLEVLVLGINPHNNSPFEEDIIRSYWVEWLKNMGINRVEIKGVDLPSNMNSIINEFIWNEN